MKKFLNELEVYAGTICSIAMVTILFINVIGRYIIGTSLKWGEEICLILFILSIYFGATGAVRTRQHLRLEIIVGNLKPKARMIVEIINNLVFIAFNGFMFFGIMPMILRLQKFNTATAVTGIPKYLIYMWLPILFVLMSIRLVQDCVARVKDYQDDPTGAKREAKELEAMQSLLVDESNKDGGK